MKRSVAHQMFANPISEGSLDPNDYLCWEYKTQFNDKHAYKNRNISATGDWFYHAHWSTVKGWDGVRALPTLYYAPHEEFIDSVIVSEVTCFLGFECTRSLPCLEDNCKNGYIDPIHVYRFDEGSNKWQR